MINFFRTLNPLNLFLLILVALVLRIGVFVELPASLNFEFIEPFAKLLLPIPLENSFTSEENILIAMVITVIQAVLFNRVINKHNLLGKPSFLPALMYVTASCLLVPFLVLSPALICNFLLIWMIDRFLGIYKQGHAMSVMYDCGIIIGIGTIIYFPFIAMLLTLWICLLIFRAFSWREWVAGLLGFATVFFFIGVFYYWNDSLTKFYNIWLPLTSPFPTKFNIKIYDYLVLIPIVPIVILAVYHLREKFFRSFVQVRKSFQLLFFIFLVAVVSFYLKSDHPIYHFLLCIPAGAVLMAYYFLNASKRWFYEGLYVVLIGSIIYFQIF